MNKPRASSTRAASNSATRRAGLLRQGNVNALSHGVFAKVNNARDVSVEIALTFAAHPDLDRVADVRLVELFASTNVSLQRALVALDTEGHTQILTGYASRTAALVERCEQRIFERERVRRREKGPKQVLDMALYAQPKAINE